MDFKPNRIHESGLPMTYLFKYIDKILRTEDNCDGEEYQFYKQVHKNPWVHN